jgi:alpha-glucosidase
MSDEWWRGAVIYQIYPLSFFDSNDDGIGDLCGIERKLDHVASLGVDAIWISPFFTSPMKDFGYDVSDYRGVNPIFGTIADFQRLTQRAHVLGLKVIIDQVWSHSSSEHPWFIESRQSQTNPRADWYVWHDPSPDGTPPNNWLAVFGGQAWTWEPRRRQYYLHHFLDSQPSLNLRNDAVLEALFDSARFWIDQGVDGFRFDAVDFMLHDEALTDNPALPLENGVIPSKPFGLQTHLYDMVNPDTSRLMERIRRFTDTYPGIATLGEVSSQAGAMTRIGRYTGRRGHRLHMAYALEMMKRPFSRDSFLAAIEEAETSLDDGWLCWAFSNHDVDRAVSRWLRRGAGDPDIEQRFAQLLMALLLTLKGSVCVYQGEELGLTHVEVPHEHMRDPYGIAFYPEFRGRDAARTPMPWVADAPSAGFTRSDNLWLPVPEAHRRFAVDRLEAEPVSLLARWRAFLALRRRHPALRSGSIEIVETEDPVLGFRRRADSESLTVLLNLSGQATDVDCSGFGPIEPLPDIDFPAVLSAGRVLLEPYGYLVCSG